MPVMQQAGLYQSDNNVGASSLRADITPDDGVLNSVRLARLSENSPAMPLNPAAVSAAYATRIDSTKLRLNTKEPWKF